VKPPQALLRRALPLGMLVALVMTVLGSFAVAHAAGATIRDDAGLFTSTGQARINKAARDAGLNVLVLTSAQSFQNQSAWRSWVRQNAGDANTVTIGLLVGPHKQVYVLPGSSTGISASQADQAYQNARPTFNNHTSSATSSGVAQLITNLKGAGATSSGGSGSSQGIGIGGILVPLIILGLLAFVLMRVLGGRRRNVAPGFGPGQGYGQQPMGPGPYNQGPQGPYQGQGGYPNQGFGNQGNQGGGLGRSILGGVAGGVAGSFIGNEIFGNHGSNANAAGPDAGANAPGDTANAQDAQGGWGGDAGGSSGADAGGFGGGGDSGGSWGGDSGGGDSGGGWS